MTTCYATLRVRFHFNSNTVFSSSRKIDEKPDKTGKIFAVNDTLGFPPPPSPPAFVLRVRSAIDVYSRSDCTRPPLTRRRPSPRAPTRKATAAVDSTPDGCFCHVTHPSLWPTVVAIPAVAPRTTQQVIIDRWGGRRSR